MRLPTPTAERSIGRAHRTYPSALPGTSLRLEFDIALQDCPIGKRLACTAAGLATVTALCGGGAFLLSPACIYALDQLAGFGCCDCLPEALAEPCRNYL